MVVLLEVLSVEYMYIIIVVLVLVLVLSNMHPLVYMHLHIPFPLLAVPLPPTLAPKATIGLSLCIAVVAPRVVLVAVPCTVFA